MNEQNLGLIERAIRTVLGLGLGVWVFVQPELGAVEWVALIAASFLILNGIFGRCYLWMLLRVNTCEPRDKNGGRRRVNG
ncbi:MAG: DUF2892 domain-containing protein [Gammaproteobacteria bacterium]|nr:DUF2892 domain-containing protein [Gammaproteobacteria bacterium]